MGPGRTRGHGTFSYLRKKMKGPEHWDEEILYTSGDRYFSDLLAAVSHAAASIDIETYIFDKGILGDRFSEALIAAARRGVRVRLIVDGLGSPSFVWTYYPKLKAGGVRVRLFRVFPWILRRLPGDPKSLTQRFLFRLRQMNSGNHRKFCLIDDVQLWAGSFNISDYHLQEVHGDEAWKDVGIKVCGGEVRYARRAFRRAFRGWVALNWPMRSPQLLLLNDSYLHKRRARVEQIQRIKRANHRIWLATPYFVPIGRVYRLLVKKAELGLDVRLIVPFKNDLWFMPWMSIPLLRDLADHGVQVYVYQPRFSHQKVFIADNWICIGSTNLNHRSFLHDLEMDVVVTHPGNMNTILASYAHDQSQSQPFDSSSWSRLPFWKRWLGLVFRLAKYWS